ncbi:MAG: hydroxymethylpyrimidine pyrophosphatase-like HAD family hydrolase [Desulforhopalus sp.]|jgi:hydroxymethylpyrimidine pyrophosphatase-like HAD family hydrolase
MEINRHYKGLFAVDLDGTLLTDEKRFNPRDLTALQKLRDHGYAVAIATGRSDYSFNSLMEKLQIRGSNNSLAVDYVCFSTGAGLMEYPAEILMNSISLPEGDVCTIVNHLESTQLDYMIHRPVPETHYFKYRMHGGANPDFLRRLDIYSEYGSPLTQEGMSQPGEATEVLCIVPGDRGKNVAMSLQATFPQFSVIRATSPLDGESSWIEIFAPTVSKSSSMAWLAKRLGISRQNTCAVGNDYNDEDLLSWAGKSYLVDNGPASLKKMFSVVASNNGAGTCEAISLWLGETSDRQ